MSYCSHARAAITAPEILAELEATIVSEVTARSTAILLAADLVIFHAGATGFVD